MFLCRRIRIGTTPRWWADDTVFRRGGAESFGRRGRDYSTASVLVGSNGDGYVPLSYQYVTSDADEDRDVVNKNANGKKLCVMVHGMLGQGKNLRTFARRIVSKYPDLFDVLLVDLRGHGKSPAVPVEERDAPGGRNTVHACAKDVLALFDRIGRQPDVLIGHSFGGKVALSVLGEMVSPDNQDVYTTNPILPRTWVWDSVPCEVAPSNYSNSTPSVFEALHKIKEPIESKKHVLAEFEKHDVHKNIAMWMTTNMVLHPTVAHKYNWAFNLQSCEELYDSYCKTDLLDIFDNFPVVDAATVGASDGSAIVNFIRAGQNKIWSDELIEALETIHEDAYEGQVGLHIMEDLGHWIHSEDPDRVFSLLDGCTLSKF
eukprot:g6871.t1